VNPTTRRAGAAPFDAAILDVDGVLTRTATLHEEAWARLFEPLLRARGDARPFSRDDYLAHVDGKPRHQGLIDFLASRGIELPPDEARELTERKNRLYLELIDRGGVDVFEDAVESVRRWRDRGLWIAFVSASKNAGQVLRAAGLDRLCDVRVDGETAAMLGLADKRELFREGARRLEVEPARAFVVEDAVSGVEAAAAAGFARVVGVARDGGAEVARELAQRGADVVVAHLDELEEMAPPMTRRASSLPRALGAHRLDTRLDDKQPVVLLDFDGTLAPIVARPDDAAISDDARRLLRELAAYYPVAVVSGRDLQDVVARVGVDDLWYAGNHGFEIISPDGRTFTRDEARPALESLSEAETTLHGELGEVPGVVLERKAFALAVHYRTAAEADAERAIQRAAELAEGSDALRLHWDLKVVELRPDVAWDKGYAVREILGAIGADPRRCVPVYVGDGPTDEDAFRALAEVGLGILVGAPRRPTFAHLRLDAQDEVPALLERLIAKHDRDRRRPTWTLRFEGWDPKREGLREALCTLGNGNFATRGAAEEAVADGIHYPGTYWAGGYDRIASEMHGEVLVNENLVNWPNWLRLSFRPHGGEWLSLALFEVLEHEQELDMRRGVLRRRLRVRDRVGRETYLASRRVVSMDDASLAFIEWELTPINWSGRVEFRSALDGGVINDGVARYRQLRGDHLVPEAIGADDEDTIWLVVRTRQSRIRMAQVARTRVTSAWARPVYGRGDEAADRTEIRIAAEAEEGRAIRLEKVVAVQTSRDPAISEPLEDAREGIRCAPEASELAARHAMRWAELWRRCDIRLGSGRELENRILRVHIFHLLQVISPHIIHRDTGVPARGLHGEAYRGHVFWDELFILPVLNFQIPELARELLLYRYLRLGAAKAIARSLGHAGAAFPWQSGSSGREESQVLHLNPRSGRWVPDETVRQRHINAAVAWNVWNYVEVTDDGEFLAYYGAEMMLEIARFWASLAEWDEALERYRIRQVVGPDEFHTRYPNTNRPGIDDNAYTNVMASWSLRAAERALAKLDDSRRRELLANLGITEGDRRRWDEVARNLRVVLQDDGIISQFDGYADLEELDWEGYRARYGDIHRLDRILEAEGDTTNRYKASKQGDMLMLSYLLGDDALLQQLSFMGYELSREQIRANIDYYLHRTSHGSTLSSTLHSWVLARHDRAHSWRLFQQALRADVDDSQGGTTAEGIHLGAMAGTIDLARRGYTGISVRDGVLWLDPQLPDEMPELCMRLRFRNVSIDLRILHDHLRIALLSGEPSTTRVGLRGKVFELERGRARHISL
jgi:alpha,alpha-trehalase